MKNWEFRIADGQLTQVSSDQQTILQQMWKLQASKNEEIVALRAAMYALANALEMHNAVCGALLREVREST